MHITCATVRETGKAAGNSGCTHRKWDEMSVIDRMSLRCDSFLKCRLKTLTSNPKPLTLNPTNKPLDCTSRLSCEPKFTIPNP